MPSTVLKGFAYNGLVIDLMLPDANGLDLIEAAVAPYPDLVPSSSPASAASTTPSRRSNAAPSISSSSLCSWPPVARAGGGDHRRACGRRTPNCARSSRSLPIRQRSRPGRRCSSLPEPRAGRPDEQHRADQGETGTGKELIARTIHHLSPRAEALRRVQRGAIPEPLAESRALRPRARAPSPAPSAAAWAASSWRTGARSSSTKSR